MNDLSATLAFLSAMVTPAVLILACGNLSISTSNRLGRVMDRTRQVAEGFEKLLETEPQGVMAEEQRGLFLALLGRAARRSRLLQNLLASLYLALGVFVATSVVIGVSAIFEEVPAWTAMIFGLVGIGLLLYASVLLIVDARIALAATEDEVDFLLRLGQRRAAAKRVKARAHRKRRGIIPWR